MMRGTLVEAFVKFKGEDDYINVAKTTDYRELENLEEEFNKRDDVEKIYFVDYITGRECKTMFDVYQCHHDAIEEDPNFFDYL